MAVDGEFLNQLTVLATDRNQRVLDQEPRIPTLLWVGLIFGGVLVVAIAGFVQLSSRRAHVALASGVALLLGLLGWPPRTFRESAKAAIRG